MQSGQKKWEHSVLIPYLEGPKQMGHDESSSASGASNVLLQVETVPDPAHIRHATGDVIRSTLRTPEPEQRRQMTN